MDKIVYELLESFAGKEGIPLSRLQVVQAFTFGGMTETSLYAQKGNNSVNMLLVREGVWMEYKGKTMFVPMANVIAAYV